MPPPRVSPPTPVVEMMPPGAPRPNGYVAWSTSPHVAPPPTRAVRLSGSTRTFFIVERSMTSPSSTVPKPGTLCPPPRTARSSPLSPAARTTAITSAASVQRTTAAGLRSCMPL